jgi:photosynthetic reaction center cytochrome c subunit
MKLRSRLILAGAGMAVVWLAGLAMVDRAAAQGKAAPAAPASAQSAGAVFKNVSTSTLKGLTVDDFLGAMGVISADLGLDCADCHPGAGSDRVDWVFDTERKKTARKMVEMVATINRTNFSGVQNVTCFTCHHGRLRPTTTIALDTLYGPPNEEKEDIVATGEGVPSANQVLDKYIDALGGAQRLSRLTSFVATGTSLGYEGLGGGGSFQILAKAPDQRVVQIVFKDHPERGDSIRVFNGRNGWVKSPRGLLTEYELTGSELDGLRLDALMAFPGQIKQNLNNLRAGNPDDINGKEVQVVQGTSAKGILVTMYFDKQSGLLVRMIRYSRSPVGRIPTQSDYADYRDVGGIKFPFQYTYSWLDGKDAFKLTDVKTNVAIDAAKFNKPQ